MGISTKKGLVLGRSQKSIRCAPLRGTRDIRTDLPDRFLGEIEPREVLGFAPQGNFKAYFVEIRFIIWKIHALFG
jgi:hypothetical protein